MTAIGSYQVTIQTQSAGEQVAVLYPAKAEEMPTNWTFDWSALWQSTDFDCQNIVKLVYAGQVWGLVRYGLYPYPGNPKFLEIEQLEANPTSRGEDTNRLIKPIGQWLIWYATKVGLQYCLEDGNTLIFLVSLDSAVGYYRYRIQMEYLEPVTIAPGEDGYAFRFSRTDAAGFCRRHESQWGVPTSLGP